MKFIKASVIVIGVCALAAVVGSCNKKDPGNKGASFDTQAPITNIGNNIIVPSYQALSNACNTLDSSVTVFNASPDNNSLTNLQSAFKNAYRAWQSCSSFGFGPADDASLSVTLNTFPTDTGNINNNITSGTYNLETISNLSSQGFPGMDYLLFGVGADNNSILLKYTTDGKATQRKQYLAAVSSMIKSKTNAVFSSWQSGGGNYIHTFVTATGTDVGSSISQLVNQTDYDFEILKNNKIGIPLGKQSAGSPLPQKTEAFYCGISSELASLQLKSIQNIYLGLGTQGDGAGLDACLVQLNSKYANGLLSDTIKSQFVTARAKLQALPDPLSATVISNSTASNSAYTELQKLTVLLKTDMPSALSILITYGDTDGD